MDLDILGAQFTARASEMQQLYEDIVHISDGIPNGSVLIVLMNFTIVLFQEIGISKSDAIRFFQEACDENMIEE